MFMALEGQVRSVVAANSSAVDLVTSEIRRAVLTGALSAGEQFSIRDLAAQLGVSHIPIREALRRLESQGLIVLRQARSASVAPLSTGDLAAIYRLRYVVELPLAGASAGRRDPAEIARLDALLEGSRDHDPEIAWQAHYEFHEALVHPAANAWDDRVLQTLWTAAERYTHLVFDPTQITEDERHRRYEKHQLLRDAALVDDAAAMAQALREHLSANEERIRDHISAIEGR
jgi:DNA-binding GntR family transcriptional regulator